MTTKTTIIKNKKAKGLLLALAAGFLLTGCDSIQALPSNYEKEVIVNNEDNAKVEVYDNIMGTLYDGISSSKKDNVLENFIYIVAQDQFGTYSEVKKLLLENDDAKIKSFIDAHQKVYYGENDEYLAEKFSTTVDAIRKQRLVNFFEDVTKQINESFYDEITGSTYKDDTGKFYEERLAMAHYAEMYDIDMDKSEWYEGYLTPSLKKEDVSEVLHLDDGRYDDYIEKKLIKSIYKDKLVEEYLLKNNYSTLGRAYARKVNVIKLTRDDDYQELANSLMNTFVDSYILGEDATSEIDFETLANAWRGFRGINADGTVIPLSSEEEDLLDNAGVEKKTFEYEGTTYEYYVGTQYGQLIDKFSKIDQNNRFADDESTSALSEFTGSYTYTVSKGLKIKLAELAKEDYTTDGWYVKNGGLTDLPDAIRNRLFNINVSNQLDNDEVPEETSSHEYDSSKYVRHIAGHYYLTPATAEDASSNPRDFVMYDSGSFYLVQIEEAASTSKLDIDGKEGYVEKGKSSDSLFTEEIAREIAKTLGTKDSYVNNAYASFIEEYSLIYHDSSIYDYFEEKFPELFEDD